ncbi:(5-formylfuran-3-yl)methyl phosphate synthase [Singulisphaera sp. PoT]|uniref:(5-formylfuran-3-yl)methyl phosphate synthase n=1 Tax=Singulisphaera sp. PoT TaxID=3411797 RepID=UPI003BF4FD75
MSVRSAVEAITALRGGAAVIDVKEPDRGALGRADASVWREVRRVLPAHVPLSVALGELAEWDASIGLNRDDFRGIEYRKLGLAGSHRGWARQWAALRKSLGPGPSWVAVVYADWRRAFAPHPDEILDEAVAIPDCSAVLVDTWIKDESNPLDESWLPWIDRARASGKKVVLAGGLDEAGMKRLAFLQPDLFAVRGAACQGEDRRGSVNADRVRRLVEVIDCLIPNSSDVESNPLGER